MAAQTWSLTKYAFVMHLKATNNLTGFKTYIDGLAWDSDVAIEWTFKNLVRKDGLLVAAVKTELGLTDQQVDTFFNNASLLED